jgi:hypothetical protein
MVDYGRHMQSKGVLRNPTSSLQSTSGQRREHWKERFPYKGCR